MPRSNKQADLMIASIERVMKATGYSDTESAQLMARAEETHGAGSDNEQLVNTAIRLGSIHLN